MKSESKLIKRSGKLWDAYLQNTPKTFWGDYEKLVGKSKVLMEAYKQQQLQTPPTVIKTPKRFYEAHHPVEFLVDRFTSFLPWLSLISLFLMLAFESALLALVAVLFLLLSHIIKRRLDYFELKPDHLVIFEGHLKKRTQFPWQQILQLSVRYDASYKVYRLVLDLPKDTEYFSFGLSEEKSNVFMQALIQRKVVVQDWEL